MLKTNQYFRDMYINNPDLHNLDEEEVKRVQKVLMMIMTDIHETCVRYSLTYCLGGGSSIGAVRHKGFIPWDDDIDLVMPRKDYEKIGRLMEKDYPDKYWIQDIFHGDGYDLSFMKIRLKGSFCQELLDPEPEKAGVFIDIFPLENAYENKLLYKLHGYAGGVFLLACSCVRLNGKKAVLLKNLKDPKGIRAVKFKIALGRVLSVISLNRWLRITEKVLSCCRNEKSSMVTIPSGRKHYFTETYTRASFFPAKLTRFEGKDFYIMKDPDEYMTKMYGDYMQIPPEDKREKHSVLRLSLPEGF